MPRRFTMTTLVTRCQRRVDMENQSLISESEWKALISEVYGELYSEVALTGYRYFEYETTVTATGAASYTEPTGHLATVSLDRVLDDDRRVPLVELKHQEEGLFAGQTGDAVAYMLVDDALYLFPNPSSGTYKWRYIAQPPDLSSYDDGDLVDVVTPDGEAFLIWGVAVLAGAKSETNVQLAIARQEAARERLQVWCANRNIDGQRRTGGVGLGEWGDPGGWIE